MKRFHHGSRSEKDEEYLKVQQDLYNILPSVADSIDDTGQAHLKSADAIREEIDALKVAR